MNKDTGFNANNYPISKRLAVIEDWVSNPKHRKIYEKRIRDEYTYDQLASEFGYSENQIGNIVRKCNKVVETHINDDVAISRSITIVADENGYLKPA